ncbi:hypothetical protein, partial [Paraburkholderia sp.]|uniref:hypothetical protein n=1 Tax=Paraburkholderia sp. TaxID=1926495 RepID=UPI002F3EAE99
MPRGCRSDKCDSVLGGNATSARRLRAAGGGRRAAGCGLRAAGCGLRAAGCGLQRKIVSAPASRITLSALIEARRAH